MGMMKIASEQESVIAQTAFGGARNVRRPAKGRILLFGLVTSKAQANFAPESYRRLEELMNEVRDTALIRMLAMAMR
jgi:hypothetical protein